VVADKGAGDADQRAGHQAAPGACDLPRQPARPGKAVEYKPDNNSDEQDDGEGNGRVEARHRLLKSA